MLCGWQDARGRRELRSSHFAANRAWRDPHPGIVTDALRFSHIAARHYEELAAILAKPDWSSDWDARFAKGSERNVFLTSDGAGD